MHVKVQDFSKLPGGARTSCLTATCVVCSTEFSCPHTPAIRPTEPTAYSPFFMAFHGSQIWLQPSVAFFWKKNNHFWSFLRIKNRSKTVICASLDRPNGHHVPLPGADLAQHDFYVLAISIEAAPGWVRDRYISLQDNRDSKQRKKKYLKNLTFLTQHILLWSFILWCSMPTNITNPFGKRNVGGSLRFSRLSLLAGTSLKAGGRLSGFCGCLALDDVHQCRHHMYTVNISLWCVFYPEISSWKITLLLNMTWWCLMMADICFGLKVGKSLKSKETIPTTPNIRFSFWRLE